MSYTISLKETVPCPHCATRVRTSEELFSRNHTANTSQMWKDGGVDFREWHDRVAGDMVAPLEKAIHWIQANRETCLKYEPANRWGTYETTLKFLNNLLDACREHTDAIVRVCS